jgi:hypothetical protein
LLSTRTAWLAVSGNPIQTGAYGDACPRTHSAKTLQE